MGCYGVVTLEQAACIQRHVVGRRVTDLGAGSGEMARGLLALGAVAVTAVDKEPIDPIAGVRTVRAYFKDFGEDIDVAFLSWPPNWECPGLIEALGRAATVVYLGKTTDGTMCGWPGLWRCLTRRAVLAEHRSRSNTLIVYGRPCGRRAMLADERAGVHDQELREYREP